MHYLHLNQQPFSGKERWGEAGEVGEGAHERTREKPFNTAAQPPWPENGQKEAVKSPEFLSSEVIHHLGFARVKLLLCQGRCFVKLSLRG